MALTKLFEPFPNYYNVGKYLMKSTIKLMEDTGQYINWKEIIQGATYAQNTKSLIYCLDHVPTDTLETLMDEDEYDLFEQCLDILSNCPSSVPDYEYLFEKTSKNNEFYFKYALLLAQNFY